MNKKLRYYTWLLNGLFKRYYKTILVVFISAILLVVLGTRYGSVIWKKIVTKNQVIGMVGSYTPVNLPINIQRLISLGLTDIQESGEAIPALAKSWDISEDGKTYVFHLKDGLYWHDGKKFTAYDVNYNLKDVEFVAESDTKLTIQLKNPFVPLPNILSKPLFKKGLVGLGAYSIKGIKLKGEYVTYLKLISLDPELPQIEIKFYPSENMAKTAFKLGEVNVLDEIENQSPFAEWNNITINKNIKYNRVVALFFNLNDAFVSDKEVRQGLAFAINKPETNRVLTPLSSKSWAYTTRVKTYEKDETLARSLLEPAIASQSGNLVLSTFSQFLPQAQIIASEWEAVGIKTDIKIENGITDNFQVFLAMQEMPSDPDQYTLWHSTQNSTNISKYTSAKIDKLLEDGRSEPNKEERKNIYFDFQRYLVEDAPAVFLYHPETYTIVRN